MPIVSYRNGIAFGWFEHIVYLAGLPTVERVFFVP
jgi:hypothetical protein